MTITETKLAAALLGMAADHYGNHGCNDLDPDIVTGLSWGELEELRAGFERWNGEPATEFSLIPDFALMEYAAHCLRSGGDIGKIARGEDR